MSSFLFRKCATDKKTQGQSPLSMNGSAPRYSYYFGRLFMSSETIKNYSISLLFQQYGDKQSLVLSDGRLDRRALEISIPLLAIRLPGKHVVAVRSLLQDTVLSVPRVKFILPADTGSQDRLLLLAPNHTDPEAIKGKFGGPDQLLQYQACIVPHILSLNYDNWSVDDLLHLVLPKDVQVISSFETIGHVAHLNLRPEHEPYYAAIGQIIIDKNPSIKTVVTKTSEIQNTFRVFPMQVIAGDPDLKVQIRQNGCMFRFDYGEVYWNTRLEHEHERLVKMFKPGQLVADVFAGVGPFSIPAAKKGVTVLANDLNPASYDALCANQQENHIPNGRMTTFNMDGGDFIASLCYSLGSRCVDHFIMNLPASATQFLKHFYGLLEGHANPSSVLPRIHCYLFSRENQDPLEIVREELGGELEDAVCHWVRNVAPGKEMYCVSFRLPLAVAVCGREAKKTRIK